MNAPKNSQTFQYLIAYVGEDTDYWKNLKKAYRDKYPDVLIGFFHIDSNMPANNITMELLSLAPDIAFFDLPKRAQKVFKIGKNFLKGNFRRKTHSVLILSNDCEITREQTLLDGFRLIYIKNQDFKSLVFSSTFMAMPELADRRDFVVGKVEGGKAYEALFPAKINAIAIDGLAVNTDYDMPLLTQTSVEGSLFKDKIIANDKIYPVGEFESAYKRSFKKTFQVEIDHLGEFIIPDHVTKARRRVLEIEKDERLEINKRNFISWFSKKNQETLKDVKRESCALVISNNYSFLENNCEFLNTDLDIQISSYLIPGDDILELKKPDIIYINFDKKDTLDSAIYPSYMFNSDKALFEILKRVKRIPDYNPFIFVFNSPFSSKELQGQLQYRTIIGGEEEITCDKVLSSFNYFTQKLETLVSPKDNDEVISELDYREWNTLFIKGEIQIFGISENEIIFDSKEELQEGSLFALRLDNIVVYATVISRPDFLKGTTKSYALLHGMSDTEKMKVRRFVQSTFFVKQDAAKREDLENWKNKNEAERIKRKK